MDPFPSLRNSPYQCTPLHLAAYRGLLDTVRLLVDKGADTTIKNEDGVSERVHTADYKIIRYIIVLLIRVCSQSPDQVFGIHCCTTIPDNMHTLFVCMEVRQPNLCSLLQQVLHSATVTITHYLLMFSWLERLQPNLHAAVT